VAQLEVIFDPVKELAAIVNVDERRSWGPAMIGPNAGAYLDGWLAAMPFDPVILDEGTACEVFVSFLAELGDALDEIPPTPDIEPLEPIHGRGMEDAALAEAVASASGAEPPSPQPADTDVAGDESPPSAVVDCPNCNGLGKLDFGGDTELVRCNMCKGTGQLEMPVAT
jgi:hypothetical protein